MKTEGKEIEMTGHDYAKMISTGLSLETAITYYIQCCEFEYCVANQMISALHSIKRETNKIEHERNR